MRCPPARVHRRWATARSRLPPADRAPLVGALSVLTVALAWLLLTERAATGAGAPAPDRQDPVLESGRAIDQVLDGGAARSYRVALAVGQFVRVVVDQRGIDVVVALEGPGGGTLAEVDSPNDTIGPEYVLLVAVTAGEHRLVVRSPQNAARAGRIEVKLVELRAATPQDEARVAAQTAVTRARALRDQRTAESQRGAIERYREALPLWRATGERLGEAYCLHAMGLLYGDIGEYQEALDSYSRAQALYAAIGDELGQARVLGSAGWVYGVLGEYEKAIGVHERALQAYRRMGATAEEPRQLGNIGANYARLGQYRKALEIHLQVLSIRRAAGDRAGQAITLNNIANCYEQLGDRRQAFDYYGRALALMPEVGNAFYTATTLNHLGVLERDLGQPRQALDRFDQALQLRRTIGDVNGEAATLYEIARLERDRGNLDDARARIEGALTAVESLRGKLGSQQLRASFFATVRQFHEFHVDLLMRLHAQRPSEGFDALALQASERARARSLLELLAEAGADLRRDGDPVLFGRESALRQKISDRADRQMRLLGGRHTGEEAAAAASELEALMSEYEQLDGQIQRANPRYAALIRPVPLSLREIQKEVLDEESLLLEYALGDERSFLFAATSTSMSSFVLPGRKAIESAARRLTDLVTARSQSVANETPAERNRRLERADAEYPAAAAALSRMLLGPVADRLDTRRLLIVGEGVLLCTPFPALPRPGGDDSRPLVVDHEFSTLPSSSVLSVLRQEMSGRPAPGKTLIVLADPVFSRDDPRVTASGERRPVPAAQAARTETRGPRGEPGLADLVRLRFSRLEADEIARLADDRMKTLAVDFAASRELATSAEMGQYRIVHFATHALVNDHQPELSGVVLSLVDEQGRPQNGFLRIYDIYGLRLRADLVVLSACQTALGKEIRGEGLIGLTRGFMYAGAPRVVASLWRIDDRATAELMKRFYQGILERGLRPASALRDAQASMWQEKRWRAPYYWAAFTFQGESR